MRETGWYWIRISENWEVGYYSSKLKRWIISGTQMLYIEEEFQEIDEKQIKRE